MSDLTAKRHGWTVVRYDRVVSTMAEAASLAARGAPDRTVVVAREQTGGRGRSDRTWMSPPGGLYATAILRMSAAIGPLGMLPLMCGVAVARTCEALAPVTCQLKWPNDVLVHGRKVAGILATSHRTGDQLVVTVGIGINLAPVPDQVVPTSFSLSEAAGSKVQVEEALPTLLRELGAAADAFRANDMAPWRGHWLDKAAFLNGPVHVVDAGRDIAGTFVGITEAGELVLSTPTGERILSAGDLVRGPRPPC